MLLKKINHIWFCGVIFIIYSFYGQAVYAACNGIGCSCRVAISSVDFGNYNPLSATATRSKGNVEVTCKALVNFTVSYMISMSKGNSNTFTSRFMRLAREHLNYNLYTTAACISVWGDGTAGTSIVNDSYEAIGIGPITTNYPVFGQLPPLQAVRAGIYTDNVIVTVIY